MTVNLGVIWLRSSYFGLYWLKFRCTTFKSVAWSGNDSQCDHLDSVLAEVMANLQDNIATV